MISQKDLETINDIEVQFGTTKLLPPMDQIPEEFVKETTKWNKLFNDWFFGGVDDIQFAIKDGIDPELALKCIQAHMVSWEPKHEHKTAGVSYMMSLLFEDVEWSLAKK